MIAFKTHASNPDNKFPRLQYLPWQKQVITLEQVDEFTAHGWSIMTQEQYDAYLVTHASEQEAFDVLRINTSLRIMSLVDPQFRQWPPSKIDFTRNLQEGIILVKKTLMAANGRPTLAKYYYPDATLEDNLVAEIRFEFTDNASKFMIERKEWLRYYNGAGSFDSEYLIHRRTYDFNSVYEAAESLRERIQARTNMIQEIKIVAQKVLVLKYVGQGQSVGQASVSAITEGTQFFNAFKDHIQAFTEVASPGFKDAIYADTSWAFLNNYAAQNVTLRQYMVSTLSY